MSACGGSSGGGTGKASLRGAGSSLIAPLVQAWIPELRDRSGIDVTYSPIGSGGGIQAINTRTVDFGASDAPLSPDQADSGRFSIAVSASYREEQVGRVLLSTLIRHAKRVGVPSLTGQMAWSNRPMQMLAMSMGFNVEQEPRNRNLRRLVLPLK